MRTGESCAAGHAELTARGRELLRANELAVHRRTDRLFANLMVMQWLAGIAGAWWITPKTWIGARSEVHLHVYAAIFLGGAIASLPIFLAKTRPGSVSTRYVTAVAQMLTSALWIHLTGGRLETHFHVFGSLAFLAIYRDWRVLLIATIVAATDHFARGLFWPQSVFGVTDANSWRWVEHAAWVVFENTFLWISMRQSLGEMREVAARRASLEDLNANIEKKVAERTDELAAAVHSLQKSEQRFRTLSVSAPVGIFETERAGSVLYANPAWQTITGRPLSEVLDEEWIRGVHPEETGRISGAWNQTVAQAHSFDEEFHFSRPDGEVRWVHARTAPIRGDTGDIIGHVGTIEDITERKLSEARLEKAQKQLLETSRMAGMAEVATSVLHNVGNVLNSVNVASTCVADGVRKSRGAALARVVALLQEHEADLGAFFTVDPRARQLPGFLAQLAEHLAGERSAALQELGHLQKNIDHIKEIVAMQQTYGKISGVTETVEIAELVEDTLRMNAESFAHHHVRIVREFSEVPPVTVEKHKVLQILVNLVRNAKHACEAMGTGKTMIVRVGNGNGTVKVAVSDNGIGIPPENLTRIFNHGFTTKKEGHGFGLHSGALAAKELGGSLRVESEGAGLGATFTLELPARSLDAPALAT